MDGLPGADPLNQRIPKATKPPTPHGITEETPSGIVLPGQQSELMPDMSQLPYQTQPEPNVYGSDEETSWDQQVERVPVYQLPDGREYVGDLQWAPSVPQDLQPIEYRMVPRSGTAWKTT